MSHHIQDNIIVTGNEISATGSNVAINTSTYTSVASITLTPGKWLLGATIYVNNDATQIGADAKLFFEGSNSSTIGKDFIGVRYGAGLAATMTFHPRVVTVAAGDSDKTASLQAASATAAGHAYGFISALQIG